MERLDKSLLKRGLARSRTEAARLIAAGQVMVDGAFVSKASVLVSDDCSMEISGPAHTYVSRGGEKLAGALDTFALDVTGLSALDVGASTGGFTDCLLQRGVLNVTAIDVGHGQMNSALSADPRVHLREGVNARYISPADFETAFDVIVVDLSFISLTLVLPALAPLLAVEGQMICLVKPQFEVGAGKVGKNGIVRDPATRQAAITSVTDTAKACGLCVRRVMESPITGGDGNVEYLIWVTQ